MKEVEPTESCSLEANAADQSRSPSEDLVAQGARLTIGGAIASVVFELGTKVDYGELNEMQHMSSAFQLISLVVSASGVAATWLGATHSRFSGRNDQS